MASNKILGALAVTTVLAFGLDCAISDKKLIGGTTPSTVSNKEWEGETEKRLQTWPRTAGTPVVMNPISRQNFIDKVMNDAVSFPKLKEIIQTLQSGKKGVTDQHSARLQDTSQGAPEFATRFCCGCCG